jgi:hypothetical protein
VAKLVLDLDKRVLADGGTADHVALVGKHSGGLTAPTW